MTWPDSVRMHAHLRAWFCMRRLGCKRPADMHGNCSNKQMEETHDRDNMTSVRSQLCAAQARQGSHASLPVTCSLDRQRQACALPGGRAQLLRVHACGVPLLAGHKSAALTSKTCWAQSGSRTAPLENLPCGLSADAPVLKVPSALLSQQVLQARQGQSWA